MSRHVHDKTYRWVGKGLFIFYVFFFVNFATGMFFFAVLVLVVSVLGFVVCLGHPLVCFNGS